MVLVSRSLLVVNEVVAVVGGEVHTEPDTHMIRLMRVMPSRTMFQMVMKPRQPVRVLTMLTTAHTAEMVSGSRTMETVMTMTPVKRMHWRLWLKMVRYWSV